jgi:hypothetical protein
MDCWKCNKAIAEGMVKIGFRAVCNHCGVDLHVCVNCRYYAPGKPNDCAVPGTEYIRDREAYNFCEEFKPKISGQPPPSTDKKKGFDSLFKDEERG